MATYAIGQSDDKAVKERFILFCNTNKITQTNLSVLAATPLATVNRWFNENIPTLPSLNAVHNLTVAHELNFSWLMTGLGKMQCYNKEYWNPIVGDTDEKQTIVQTGSIIGDKTAIMGKSCENCPFPKAVEKLTQQNEKLTDKLLEKL